MTLPPPSSSASSSMMRRKTPGRHTHHHSMHRRRMTTVMMLCMFLLLIVVVSLSGVPKARFFASQMGATVANDGGVGSTVAGSAKRLVADGGGRDVGGREPSTKKLVVEQEEATQPMLDASDASNDRHTVQEHLVTSAILPLPPLLTTQQPSTTAVVTVLPSPAVVHRRSTAARNASTLVPTRRGVAAWRSTTIRNHSQRTFPPQARGRVLPPRGIPFWGAGRSDSPFDTIGDDMPIKASLLLGADGKYVAEQGGEAATKCGAWVADAVVNNEEDDAALRSQQQDGASRNTEERRRRRHDAIDSVVWLTFDIPYNTTDAATTTNYIAPLNRSTAQWGADIAKQLIIDAMACAPALEGSDYHMFFAKYNASLSVEDPDRALQPATRRQRKREGSVEEGAPRVLVPLQLDVVYTYINTTSPSHLSHTTGSGNLLRNSDPSRFRDWNELVHSMRAVYRYGVCLPNSSRMADGGRASYRSNATKNNSTRNDDSSSKDGNDQRTPSPSSPSWCTEGTMIRKIFLVVADADQAPAWLRQEDPRIEIVAHRDIFPEEDVAFLPTFNSHAIESALHRIPGISRFYVYFNNDMFWGRSVSWFDYFRPLSQARQAHRVQRLGHATRQQWETSGRVYFGVDDDDASATYGTVVKTLRVTVAMEPILYFEGLEDTHDCRAWPKPEYRRLLTATTVAAATVTETTPSRAVTNGSLNSTTSVGGNETQPQGASRAAAREEPVYHRDLFGAAAFLPQNGTNVTAEMWEQRCSQNPLWVGAMFDFKCPVRGRHVRTRLRPENIWRHFVDNNKAMAFKRLDGGHWPTHTFAHFPRLMDRQLMASMEDDVFADVAQRTRRSRERTVDSLWTTHLHQWHALAQRRHVDRPLLMRLAGRSDESNANHRAATNDSTVREVATLPSPPPSASSWSAPAPGSPVTMLTVHPFAADEVSNQLMGHPALRYATSPGELLRVAFRPDGPTATSDTNHTEQLRRQHTVIEASSGTSLLEEKLNFHVVRLDRKRGGYYFCMMKTLAAQARCLSETVGSRDILGGVQLFVTVNDDFPRLNRLESLFHRAYDGAQRLFEGLTGHAPPAPWEHVE